jgi:hypothetical protein
MNKRSFIASIYLAVASVFVVAPAAAQEFAKLVGERTNGKSASLSSQPELAPISCTGLLAN